MRLAKFLKVPRLYNRRPGAKDTAAVRRLKSRETFRNLSRRMGVASFG